MRPLLALGLLFALGGAVLAGCGVEYPLPTEARGGAVPDLSYQMVATWIGMDGITDILLTQGGGSQLFLLFNHGGSGTARRGEVLAYPLKGAPPTPRPISGIDFPELFNPVALCAGGDGVLSGPRRVFVLDRGDTALARDPVSGRVTDPSLYWRVLEYTLLGGTPLSSFTDTSVAFVQGVAADDQGSVYVSGTAIILIPDPSDPRIRTRSFQYRVYRYSRRPAGDPRDPNVLPEAAPWRRDATWVVEEGSGVGTVQDPRGIFWSPAGEQALYVADFGKNWVQKVSDSQPSNGLYLIDAAPSKVMLSGPGDVAVDLAGAIYITDSGNHRVLRCDPDLLQDSTGYQRVNKEPPAYRDPARRDTLVSPVAVAADDSLVYVADRDFMGLGRVIRYLRRK